MVLPLKQPCNGMKDFRKISSVLPITYLNVMAAHWLMQVSFKPRLIAVPVFKRMSASGIRASLDTLQRLLTRGAPSSDADAVHGPT